MWASAVGYRVGADRFNVPDTDEYVKVRGDQLMARDGVLDLRMVNQLEEVIFIDRAELLAVDHPAGFEVYPNERLLPGPPFPSFEVFAVAEERVPVSAVDEEGTDVRDSILQVDRRWPDTFELLPFKGYAEEHTLILDPGDLGDGDRVVLLMDAWIDYADSTSNLAASQAGEATLLFGPEIARNVPQRHHDVNSRIPSLKSRVAFARLEFLSRRGPEADLFSLNGSCASRSVRFPILTQPKCGAFD